MKKKANKVLKDGWRILNQALTDSIDLNLTTWNMPFDLGS